MNIFFYIIIFIMGITFGSFYTLAVYRIPKGQDITHTHSYCPNCGNKLGFFELIPVLSYLWLGGKCKHCEKQIRKRYIILEILSGIMFVAYALALNLDVYNLSLNTIISFVFIVLYLTGLVLIAGTDLENKKIEKSLLAYEIIVSLIYMIYLYIIDKASIYRYAIYLVALIILLVIDNITLKKKAKTRYRTNILMLVIIMIIFTTEYITILSTATGLLAMAVYILIKKIKNRHIKTNKKFVEDIRLGFVLSVTNIIIFLNFLIASNIWM
ncbi:MAG: prepilin peptidase [Clostridia bacterium]|nr:prepilin peptidase [Clostridia bacterium]